MTYTPEQTKQKIGSLYKFMDALEKERDFLKIPILKISKKIKKCRHHIFMLETREKQKSVI